MAKVEVDLVKMVLQRAKIDAKKISDIMEEINYEIKINDDEEKEKPVKKQFVILVSDPSGKLADYTGWVVQIPEDESPLTAVERLQQGAYAFNRSPKGQRNKVLSIAEACEYGSAKLFKEEKIWIKTKMPVEVVSIKNELPKG